MRLHQYTAVQLRQMLLRRELSSVQLTQHYLNRISRFGGKGALNAVACVDPTALSQAQELDRLGPDESRPLWGLPVLIKDNIDVSGLPTTAGSFVLAENIARQDAPIVAALRKRGAVILGKTNMTEFANYTTKGMPNGFSSLGGQVVHAYDKNADPSGSSSGSGVAMSAGLCALAVGTDTSFSVVACAAANGVTGLKPPAGSISAKGIIPIAHTLDSAGALTRDLQDALMLVSAMREPPLPPVTMADPASLRIAVNISRKDDVSANQLAHYERLFSALRDAGAHFEEVDQPWTPFMGDVMRCEFREDLEEYLAGSSSPVKTLADIIFLYRQEPLRMPYGVSLLQDALSCSTADAVYIQAMQARTRLQKEICAQLREIDAVIMTGPTSIMHFTGLPSLALRLCADETDGLPKGLILYGADEQRLYSAALAIEKFCRPAPPPAL